MKSPDYNPAALAADHFKALKTGDGALACSLPGVAGFMATSASESGHRQGDSRCASSCAAVRSAAK